jgi:hypothetical protein
MNQNQSKKDQLKNLIDNQKIIPIPVMGVIALTLALLVLATAVINSGRQMLFNLALAGWLFNLSYQCFKGKIIKSLQATQWIIGLKAADVLLSIFALGLMGNSGDSDFYEIILISIVGFGVFVGIHFYLKSKANNDDLSDARRLKFIWF